MNEQEQAMAADIYSAIMDAGKHSDRSKQDQDFRLGISSIGFCPERVRRALDQQVPEDTDTLAAFIGIAMGDHIEKALAVKWPDAIFQAEVHLDLRVQGRAFRLPGHPDVLLPEWGALDGKTVPMLALVEREGPSFQQQFQRHAYGLAAWQEGYFPNLALEEVMVGNFWNDRTAKDKYTHVQAEPFNQEIIDQGVEELDSVVYSFLHGEEAEKRPPRTMCASVCGYHRVCRQWDTDVSGLIQDPMVLGAIEAYLEGHALEKQGKRLKEAAKHHLLDISGSTGSHFVRWIHINATEDRAANSRLDIKPIEKAGP